VKNKLWIPGQKHSVPKVRLPQPGDIIPFRPAAAPPTGAEDAEEIKDKMLLVQFVCGGATLAGRKMCTCYVKDEADTKFEDCVGLKHPQTGERTGLCWNVNALAQKSAAFLNMVSSTLDGLKQSFETQKPEAEEKA